MNAPLQQNLNQNVSQIHGAFNNGLAASPFTGSTNDNVLLFAAANEVVTGPAADVVIANSATIGTTVTLSKAGVYAVELGVGMLAAAAALICGISQDITASGLTTAIDITSAGALDVTTPITIVDADLSFIKLTTFAFVTPIQEAAGSVIRFHAGVTGGGPPTVMLQPLCYYRIRYMGANNITA